MASSDTPGGTRATLDAMSLVDDIVLLAGYCHSDYRPGHPAHKAAHRVLTANEQGGLPRALAGAILAGAERRLTALIQTEVEALVKTEGD